MPGSDLCEIESLHNYYYRPEGCGDTPLHAASRNGRIDLVTKYLRRGDVVDVSNLFGETPLISAARKGHTDVVLTLLRNGAKVNHEGDLGYTALHVAAMFNRQNVVSILLNFGANVNALNKLHETPLSLAYKTKNEDLVVSMFKNVTNITVFNEEGWTFLHTAASKGFNKVILALLEKGLNINALSKPSKRTPLHIAVEYKMKETVVLLLSHGADRSIKDTTGYSALDLALENKIDEIVQEFQTIREPQSGDLMSDLRFNQLKQQIELIQRNNMDYLTHISNKLLTERNSRLKTDNLFRKEINELENRLSLIERQMPK